MTDIGARLLLYAQQFEDQHAPQNITMAMRAAAAEIEQLRRDIGSMLLEREEAKAEAERLRAALEPFACHCDDGDLCKHPHVCRHYIARAALTATPAPKKENE